MQALTPAKANSKITPKQVPTLKKRSDFLRLRKGRSCHRPWFILQSKAPEGSANTSERYRIGYTVTTKCGNSVERSRIKRRLRAAVNQVFPLKAKQQNDYVLIAKRAALHGEFAIILKDLSSALDQVHGKRANVAKAKNKSGSISPKKRTRKSTDG